MKMIALRLLAIGVGIVLLTSAYTRIHSASIMSDAAKAFLASLNPDQRAQATFQFQDDERFNWHHISQNFTVTNGKVQGAPSFFGSNPEEVKDGPRKGVRILAREDDLARTLVQSLTPEQQKTAIVSKDAPKDILTEASRKAALN